jgi:hypothetical protein
VAAGDEGTCAGRGLRLGLGSGNEGGNPRNPSSSFYFAGLWVCGCRQGIFMPTKILPTGTKSNPHPFPWIET